MDDAGRDGGRDADEGCPGAAPADGTRRLGLLAILAAGALLPWTATLAALLPAEHVVTNWTLTWVGFDLGLLAALAATGLAARRRHRAAPLLAMLSVTLLLCDAWFDVTTASSTSDLMTAVLSAVLLELPLAGLLARVALAGADRDARVTT